MYVCMYVKRGIRIKEQKHQNKLLYLDFKEKNLHRSDRNFLCILLIKMPSLGLQLRVVCTTFSVQQDTFNIYVHIDIYIYIYFKVSVV